MKFYQKKLVWFTGLSGAGKSTLADKLVKHIKKKKKYKYFRIDGDILETIHQIEIVFLQISKKITLK